VPTTGTLHLGLVGGTNQQLYLSLYGASENQLIAYVEDKDNKLSLSEPVEAGTYYVKVNTTPSSSAQAYRLSSSFKGISSAVDTRTNFKKSEASKISLNQKTTGQLGYSAASGTKNTEDWFMFTIDANQNTNFSLTLSADLNARLLVSDDKGKSSIIDTRGKGQTLTANKFLTKGTYYVQLQTLNGAGSYTLSVK
ncbi:MAG: hypothetical protein ACRCTE_13500, partial [Cellulosilyticaceae bacterium]